MGDALLLAGITSILFVLLIEVDELEQPLTHSGCNWQVMLDMHTIEAASLNAGVLAGTLDVIGSVQNLQGSE